MGDAMKEFLARLPSKEEGRKRLEDYFRKIEECEKKGHPNAQSQGVSMFRGRVNESMYCPDCGAHYSGPASPGAYVDFMDMMNIIMSVFSIKIILP